MQWETVIGLEIHAQLATKTKIFSGASTAYGAEPNTQACAVDLGLPGVLPVLNQEVVRMAVKFGMAIEGEVADYSVFARKNYFYPDLPKGYQISQMDHPIVGIGHMDIDVDGQTKRVGVTRAHLEEDAGKSLHEDFHGLTGVDLNRAGTPLLEIVSEPDMRSAKEAVAYMRKIHELVQYLDICDGNMQEGSFRCDANVSIRPVGQEEYGTRTELKNINSFKFVEKAINIEVERQIGIIEVGGRITQETRLYDADKNETRSMRSKEEANDYRYFPDPDLLPVYISDELRAQVKADLPELAHIKRQRFIEQYKLDLETATQLTSFRQLADYFEALITESGCNAKICSNWVTVELSGALNKQNLDISQSPVTHERLAVLLKRISDNTISGKIAKQVFEIMWTSADSADAIIEAQGLKQITDSGAIEAIIDKIIADNQGQVEQYLSGKDKVFGFFVGQTMKASQGKANPGEVNKILKEKLKR
ncbi:Asp-tRNA(Asn)/Glu-tRNA(Gln) amidotransferase GatCAB subunit B [Methylococcaceae bacterium HT1]|nr:Asp-tRNA(Asn)/Glu-tRNA(Gln) amidotransferase GatCAB subunit B [Methylococcaceae bacterium HT1]TXL16820.1 Asp-tRNA(Asn)/Glu-tRNA(Gln) amidotransferase GatCAB subunit B [Methylococcaceae bacterium HT3]TXL22045.1 Asp-tRNA(Asn)/Glu-tRNA(Gln) amidotransferase GatCAB subunit B [Methylococcaceae bacterium HT2]